MGWYVITGGPCSGKTTLISRLSRMGYQTVPEAARIIIDNELSKGKSVEDVRKGELEFQRKVLAMKVEFENELLKDSIVFLDRGIPDSIAYFQICGFDTKEVLSACEGKMYKKVFLLEQLPFEKDYARTEDDETAKKVNELLKEAYEALGYEVLHVPYMSVEKRLEFILSNL